MMMYFFHLLLACLVLLFSFLEAEVLILTHAYNRPEFIYWQDAAFKKFLKDDYKFVVFNDAPNEELAIQIRAICQTLDLTCIDVPQEIHHYASPYLPGPRNPVGRSPSAECADTIQYMLDTRGFDHPGIVVVFDSDMFLIREMSIEDLLKDYEVAAHPQIRYGSNGPVYYFLPNLVFLNMETLIDKKNLNFNVGTIDGVCVDTGGCTYYYLQQHPHLKWLQTDCVTARFNEHQSNLSSRTIAYFKSHPAMYRLMTEMKYDYEFYINYCFIHFRAGSNWYQMDAKQQEEKFRIFYEALRDVLFPAESGNGIG